jgi:hypothetical protein
VPEGAEDRVGRLVEAETEADRVVRCGAFDRFAGVDGDQLVSSVCWRAGSSVSL